MVSDTINTNERAEEKTSGRMKLEFTMEFKVDDELNFKEEKEFKGKKINNVRTISLASVMLLY